MRRMGYSVVPGRAFFTGAVAERSNGDRDIDAGWRYEERLGLPVIVKPNRGRQGYGVVKVHTRADYYRAATFIFDRDNVMLVQRVVSGIDCRIVVFDDRIVSAYERRPLTVRGDGHSTVAALLQARRRELAARGRTSLVAADD